MDLAPSVARCAFLNWASACGYLFAGSSAMSSSCDSCPHVRPEYPMEAHLGRTVHPIAALAPSPVRRGSPYSVPADAKSRQIEALPHGVAKEDELFPSLSRPVFQRSRWPQDLAHPAALRPEGGPQRSASTNNACGKNARIAIRRSYPGQQERCTTTRLLPPSD